MDTNAFLRGSTFNAQLTKPYQRRSPLPLKGLQIQLQFKIWWIDVCKCNIIQKLSFAKVYLENEFVNDSKVVLKKVIPEDIPYQSATVIIDVILLMRSN